MDAFIAVVTPRNVNYKFCKFCGHAVVRKPCKQWDIETGVQLQGIFCENAICAQKEKE